jgi:competence protein ComEC
VIAPAAAAFVAGAWLLQQQADLPAAQALLALAFAAVLAAAVAWALVRRSPRADAQASAAMPRAAQILVVGAALALGFAYAGGRAHLRLADALAFADEGRDVVVVGVIDSLPAQLERGQRFEFKVERVETDGVRVPARLALAWYGAGASVLPAERWRFTVRLRRPHGNFNPGGFDLEAWMLERGLRASGYVRTGGSSEPPRRLAAQVADAGANVDRARYRLRAALQQHLAGERYGGVLIALVLGDQRAIAESDWQLFKATGIAHLVSISGLHVTMIAALLALAAAAAWRRSARLLRLAPVQSAAALAGMTAAFAYCLLAGWGVPAQRTFFMLAVVALAMLARLPLAPALTLALAAAVVTLLDPWASSAPGFWLSFGAVAAIFLAMRGREAPSGWRRRLAVATHVQLAVTVALVPLTIALFQHVSLVSPLANALAIPVVSLAVTPLALLGALFVLLPAPLDALAVVCLGLGHLLFAWLAAALHWAAGYAWAAVSLPAPPPWALVFAAAGVLWLLAPRGWSLRWLGAVWLLPLAVWPPARPASGELWVTALDVGQGAAVLLETRERVLLYDTGPRYGSQADAGGRVILPYLRWRGIERLDLIVVSHLDSDHSGGAASLLQALPRTPVATSIDPAHPMLGAAGSISRCAAGEQIAPAADGLELRFLHPPLADYERRRPSNAMSCVLLARFGEHRILLAGDIDAQQEAELLARAPLPALTLLAAPHHGSRHSSSPALIAAAQPRWVLFQAGYRNRFGHPDPQVLARYAAAGAVALRSDHHGALQWRLRADGARQGPPRASRQVDRRYWHNQPARAAFDSQRPADRLPEAADLDAAPPPADPPFALGP